MQGRAETGERGESASSLWVQLRSLLAAVALALTIVTFLVTTVGIKGGSMEPTLYSGERVLVPKYEVWLHRLGIGAFERGDIVYFRPPVSTPDTTATLPILGIRYRPYFIKRIIAKGGDRLRIDQGQVYVNGKKLEEPYLEGQWLGNTSMHPVTVPDGEVFVLGDNRSPLGSVDSRRFGPIPVSSIAGRAAAVIWPPVLSTTGGWESNLRRLSTDLP